MADGRWLAAGRLLPICYLLRAALWVLPSAFFVFFLLLSPRGALGLPPRAPLHG
jgi:hypothetical protein